MRRLLKLLPLFIPLVILGVPILDTAFAIVRLGLARTFQIPTLFSSFSTLDNVMLGTEPMWRLRSRRKAARRRFHLESDAIFMFAMSAEWFDNGLIVRHLANEKTSAKDWHP